MVFILAHSQVLSPLCYIEELGERAYIHFNVFQVVQYTQLTVKPAAICTHGYAHVWPRAPMIGKYLKSVSHQSSQRRYQYYGRTRLLLYCCNFWWELNLAFGLKITITKNLILADLN